MLLFYLSYQVLPFYSILEICYVLSLDVEHYDRSCVSFLCIYNISGLGIQQDEDEWRHSSRIKGQDLQLTVERGIWGEGWLQFKLSSFQAIFKINLHYSQYLSSTYFVYFHCSDELLETTDPLLKIKLGSLVQSVLKCLHFSHAFCHLTTKENIITKSEVNAFEVVTAPPHLQRLAHSQQQCI